MIKIKTCVHGVEKNKKCPACDADNVYIKEDIKIFNSIYDKRKINNFALAFRLKEQFNRYAKNCGIKSLSIDYYLGGLIKTKQLKLNPNTLKHAYYVARVFPNLEDKINRKMSFSAYSEIANAYLASDQKKVLRKEMEEKEYRATVKEIRETINTRFRPEKNRIKEKILYLDQESFLGNIKDFLNRNSNILPQGSEITLTAKPPKNLPKA